MDPNSVSERLVHNDRFYFNDDPMAIFQVENQLFKVHRHCLIEGSEVFRDMFANAGSKEGGAAEGSTDDQPIPLPDVTVQEFEALLRFFYATTLMPMPHEKFLVEILAYNQNAKLALLSIAHRFNFSKIFRYIVKEINPSQMSILERICLGDKYNLNDWLLSAYKGLVNRPPNVKWTKEEAEVLGWERVNKLLEAKNLMLHEQLQKANLYKIPLESYRIHASSCMKCHRCFDSYADFSSSGSTMILTSTEKILEKYFPGSPAESQQ